MSVLKRLKLSDGWFIGCSFMKEREQSSFFRNGYQSDFCWYLAFFDSTGSNEKDAQCSKQDHFKFCDWTVLEFSS